MLCNVRRAACAGDGGDDFFCRAVGTDVAYGVDPTGDCLGQSARDGPYRNHLLGLYRPWGSRAAGRASPPFQPRGYATHGGLRQIARLFLPLARLFLPLVDSQGTVEKLLIGQVRLSPVVLKGSAWQLTPHDISPDVLSVLAE